MKIIIDMNLSPEWVGYLEQDGHKILHWKDVGDPNAPEIEIIKWAREGNYLVFRNKRIGRVRF